MKGEGRRLWTARPLPVSLLSHTSSFIIPAFFHFSLLWPFICALSFSVTSSHRGDVMKGKGHYFSADSFRPDRARSGPDQGRVCFRVFVGSEGIKPGEVLRGIQGTQQRAQDTLTTEKRHRAYHWERVNKEGQM